MCVMKLSSSKKYADKLSIHNIISSSQCNEKLLIIQRTKEEIIKKH